jgi:K+-sensing histidine kinase KdpD
MLPDTDLALLLVLVVLAIGLTARRLAVALAGVSAALWFEFLDTRPFGELWIQRTPDLQTTLTLALVGIVGGEVTVRAVRARRTARAENVRLTSVTRAASRLASGDELGAVIAAAADDLTRLMALRRCSFEVATAQRGRARLERDGRITLPDHPADPGAPWSSSELSVWGHGQVFGHFVLEFPPGARRPSRADLLAATALVDQVGAAFMAQAPFPPEPPEVSSGPRLRVVPRA